MEINMNGNINDINYRYTIPEFKITIAGKGNGIYTIFNNISEICKTLNHPTDIIMSYIATVTGSNFISSRNTITGTHTSEQLTELILEYIKYLVMCPKCNIPETIPQLKGTKKNSTIILCCSACKNETEINLVNKRINKGIDIIIKYLKSGGIWTTSKGTMVKQSDSSKILLEEQNKTIQNNLKEDEYNPFDSI
jgi:translation initiation factor 5